MEFYKAAYRSTSSTSVTSVDVCDLFGSSGFVNYTVQGENISWGIQVLREANNLAEHIKHFAPGSRYFRLRLSDFCLINYRRVDSFDEEIMERIEADMFLCKNLFVLCYDVRMKSMVVFNSAMEIVYRMQFS